MGKKRKEKVTNSINDMMPMEEKNKIIKQKVNV